MSVFDIIGFGKKAPAPAPTPAPAATTATQETTATPEPAPLTKQAEWFKPAETDAKPVEFDATKLFDTDPAKLNEAIGNLNFLQGVVTPDIMAKIEAGGPEATQTMLQIMNRGQQQTMAAAMQAASKMIEQAVSKVQPVMDQKVTHQLKSQQVEQAIRTANPIFDTPAGGFMLDALKEAFLKKFPNATSAEIQDNAKQFVQDMIKVGSPAPTVTSSATKAETDWGEILRTSN